VLTLLCGVVGEGRAVWHMQHGGGAEWMCVQEGAILSPKTLSLLSAGVTTRRPNAPAA
jgi:hypothetical protein